MSLDKASLVLIPDGAKDGKLYSVKPIDGSGDFTFSRGSNLAATRVNENGLIEKGRENLLLNSNQFDTTWFIVGTGTLTSGQSGYDGSSDAWLFSKSAASTYLGQNTSTDVSTFSVYAKAGTNTHLAIWVRDANEGKYFDLSNGTTGSDFVSTPIDAKIEAVGNGWYRCSVTTDDATINCRIYPADGDGDVSGTSGNIYIQDAQLERGLVATDYIESGATTGKGGLLEDLPRIDFSEGVSCPSLLLEPTKTNLFTDSEYLPGNLSSNLTFTTNTSQSPEGYQNASTIVVEVDSNSTRHRTYKQFNATSNSYYTISGYFKQNEAQWIQFCGQTTNTVFTIQDYVNFDVGNGEKGDVGTDVIDSGIEPVLGAAGWYRCYMTIQAKADAFSSIDVVTTNNSNSIRYPSYLNSTATNYIYCYGLQLEEAAYATSYIPTYGISVTRSTDKANVTGTIQPYRFGGGAFSIFLEHGPIPTSSDGQVMLIAFNPLNFYFRYTNNTNLNIWNQEIQQAVINASGVDRSTNHKILMVYDGVGSTDVYIDGVKRKSGYSYTWSGGPYYPRLDTTAIVAGDISLKMNQIAIFDEALSEAKSIALTTL